MREKAHKPVKTSLRHIRNVAGDTADGLDGGRCKLLVGTADVGPELSKDGVDARLPGNVGKDVQLHVGRQKWEGPFMAQKMASSHQITKLHKE